MDKCGVDVNNIECVAEIGPGDQLGVGLAALISGANKYPGYRCIQL